MVSPSAATDVLKVEFRKATIVAFRETTFQLSTTIGTLPLPMVILPGEEVKVPFDVEKQGNSLLPEVRMIRLLTKPMLSQECILEIEVN